MLLIVSQISEITAGIISAFILDNFSIVPLVVASSILMLVSLISVFLIKEKRKKKSKDSIITYFKIVPKVTLFHLFLREASTVMSDFSHFICLFTCLILILLQGLLTSF